MATRAMIAEQGAMEASTNNLANVNTPGYSRQVPILQASDPIVEGSVVYGDGVDLQGFQSLRDNVLGLRIDEEQQNQGRYSSFVSAMDQVQTLFSDASGGIGGALTTFFNSLSSLTTQPDSSALRQTVISSANSLTSSFHSAAASLSGLQASLNQQVVQGVEQVNSLTSQIATLNSSIAGLGKSGQDAGTLEDQRDQAISDLSQLVDVSETQTEHGITITTANGVALVVDGQSYGLTTATDPTTSMDEVMSGSNDITAEISGGSLAGNIAVRDTEIPEIQTQVDELAGQFSDAVNQIHQTGIDLNGNAGGLLFSAPPLGNVGAAASIQVNISDPSQLAMSSTGTSGGDDIANSLLNLQSQAVVNGQSPIDAYSQIVYRVGDDDANAKAAQSTSSSILQQLQNQQSSVSGVSIDEETANLLQFQRGFEAAAHVITVIDSMMQSVLSMGVTQ